MVFTSSWSTISSAQTDADSPLDVVLMEGMRQNELHLYEWLGQGYTPSTAHNHNGVNSANVILGIDAVNSSAIVANAVTSTKIGTTAVETNHLKLGSGSQSWAGTTSIDEYIAVNRYAHSFRLRTDNTSTMLCEFGMVNTSASDSSAKDGVHITGNHSAPTGGMAFYVYWDYHSS